jgi:hypothetical protein
MHDHMTGGTVYTARLTLLAATTLLLTACPYSGPVPIGELQPGNFDPLLLGEWAPADTADSGDDDRLWIAAFDDDEYVFAGIGDCPDNGGRGYISRIGDTRFVNVHGVGDGSGWIIARLDRVGNDLIVRVLNDQFDSAKTTGQLRALVAARIDDPKAYDDSILMRRTSRQITERGQDALSLPGRACAYEDSVSLGEGEVLPELDALVGKWEVREQGDTVGHGIAVQRFNERELMIVVDPVMDGGDVHMRGLLTRIGKDVFLTVNSVDDASDRDVMISRIELRGDTIMLQSLNRNVRGRTPVELRAAVEKGGEIYRWGESVRLIRKK